ncbi:hypothetical protein [Umezawaea tangerina]|uniref:Uncharacterized protein n=1 Tax=Umezawaea tangerina TaxID=84725 RepID=A0A2T0T3X1_9PSEU|nr:hypothetical protein [Umezawaea tangerina]PRY40331.1 hypothetical protein CLV43_10665 [Umezawaea tangerina]
MAEVPVQNLVAYAALTATPAVLCWTAIVVPKVVRRLKRRRRVPVVPAGPSIEQVSADLRRVHRILAGYESGIPAVRRAGTRQAYDALLVQACRAVEVDHRLGYLPEGMDRELERLRVEESLRTAGLVIP